MIYNPLTNRKTPLQKLKMDVDLVPFKEKIELSGGNLGVLEEKSYKLPTIARINGPISKISLVGINEDNVNKISGMEQFYEEEAKFIDQIKSNLIIKPRVEFIKLFDENPKPVPVPVPVPTKRLLFDQFAALAKSRRQAILTESKKENLNNGRQLNLLSSDNQKRSFKTMH